MKTICKKSSEAMKAIQQELLKALKNNGKKQVLVNLESVIWLLSMWTQKQRPLGSSGTADFWTQRRGSTVFSGESPAPACCSWGCHHQQGPRRPVSGASHTWLLSVTGHHSHRAFLPSEISSHPSAPRYLVRPHPLLRHGPQTPPWTTIYTPSSSFSGTHTLHLPRP